MFALLLPKTLTNTRLYKMKRLPNLRNGYCEPTKEEFSQAIQAISSKKVLGKDGIQPDLLK